MKIKKKEIKLTIPKIPEKDKNDFIKTLGLRKFRIFTRKLLAYFGIKKAKYINSGTYGSAFNLGDGRVLKITTDKSEARNAYYLTKHPNDRFVRYYNVYKLICNEYEEDIFVILMEKLDLLNKIEDEIFYFLKSQVYCKPITNDKEERKLEIPDKIAYINEITNHGYKTYNEFIKVNNKERLKIKYKELQKRIKTNSAEGFNWDNISFDKLRNVKYKEFVRMYNEINAIIKCAFDHNIKLRDCHAGNFGYRKGKLVVFDLSLSSKRNYKLNEIKI